MAGWRSLDVDPCPGTVRGMEETREPQEAFALEFDGTGAVSGMRLADDWTTLVKLEEFGITLLMAYAQQQAEASVGTVEDFVPPSAEVRYPRELREDVIDLSRDVSSLMKALTSWSPTQQEPVEVGDRYRHITIQCIGGIPNEIKVNESWLRTADAVRIESDVVEAFRAMFDEAPRDEMLGQLAGLRERFADVVQRRNDHSRG